MPPWPPGPDGLPLSGARVLSDEEIDLFVRWSERHAPLGDESDHRDRSPEVTFDPGRPADVVATLGGDNVYMGPAGATASDEVRCFVIDLPPGTGNAWVTALRWIVGQPAAVHHIGGAAVNAQSAALARSWYGVDGRPGYECAGGLGEGLQGTAGLSASGAGADTGTMLPAGTGIFIPAGSSLVLSIHYVLGAVQGVDDESGVELWLASGAEKNSLRPMVQYTFNAPSELPCPSGVSTDPADRCSREWGIQNSGDEPAKVRVINDYLLARCGTSLDAYYARLQFGAADTPEFYVPTECLEASRYDGTIHILHNHMHTRGASAGIDVERNGSWLTLLDIPRWDWHWEAAYLLEQGVPISAGERLRVRCVYDNGADNQWSLMTNDPDGPFPLEPPGYVVGATTKKADMCGAFLTLEIAPYLGASYPDVCHEVQARYDDACGGGTANFTAQPCEGDLEALSVFLLQVPTTLFDAYVCAPKGQGADQGASCADAMSCALACGATIGFDGGITATCANACKADVSAYGMAASGPASPVGAFRMDELLECANPACGIHSTWQDYLACMQVACTELTKLCWSP